MALIAYETQTQQLLNYPVPSPLRYTTTDVDGWVNRARQQIAGDGECIRGYLTLAVSAASQQYPFSAISLTNAPLGVAGVYNIRQASVSLGNAAGYVRMRPFQWFNQYYLMNPGAQPGSPQVSAQFGQGTSGSLFINLLDGDYSLNLDCACLPEDLIDDSTPEAIPYPWTECVPFFAAFYGFLAGQRASDADAMLKRYGEFRDRARKISTPGVLPFQGSQTTDPTRVNQLGVGGPRQ